MSRIEISVDVDRSPQEVWADVRQIGSHVEWMKDAVAIRFLTERTEGLGTRFECDTRVGPLAITDVMEITAWDEGKRMGVVHHGVVTGRGQFTLTPVAGDCTRFTWDEELDFPWWLGGPVGEALGAPVLRRIWRTNLRRLKERLER